MPKNEGGFVTEKKLKMYILVRQSVPIGLGVNAVGHTSLATYMKFKDDPVMQEWVTSKHFRKVTCIVSDEQFEKAKKYPDHVIMTENAIDNAEVAMGFCPREEWPDFFRSLRLFGSHLVQPPVDPKSIVGYEVKVEPKSLDTVNVQTTIVRVA